MRTMRGSSFGALKGVGIMVGLIALWIGGGFCVATWNKLASYTQWAILVPIILLGLILLVVWARKARS